MKRALETIDLYSDSALLKKVNLGSAYPLLYISAYWIASGMVAGLILIIMAAFLVRPRTRPAVQLPVKTSPCSILAFALPMIAVWLFYWLALWPGISTLDSQDQLEQIVMGRYSDAHPVILTWTWWLILRLWNTPAAISLFHILALSAAAGVSYYQMCRLGTRLAWQLVGVALITLSIVNSLMVVTLWKDILFSTAFLLFFIFWIDILVTQGKSLGKPLYFLGFFSVAALSALYLYLFLFGVVVTAIKKGKRYLLLAVPVIAISLPIILANHSQSFRYMCPVYIISLLYWPYLLTNQVNLPEPASEAS